MLTSPRVFFCLMIGVPMLGLAGCGRDPEPAAPQEAVAADVPVPEVVAPVAPATPDIAEPSAGGEAHVHGAVGDHSGLTLTLSFTCADIEKLEGVRLNAFSEFTGFETVNAIFIGPDAQVASVLTAGNPELSTR